MSMLEPNFEEADGLSINPNDNQLSHFSLMEEIMSQSHKKLPLS